MSQRPAAFISSPAFIKEGTDFTKQAKCLESAEAV